MGLSVSPCIYRSIMITILGDLIHKGVVSYIDDILIYSKLPEKTFSSDQRTAQKTMECRNRTAPRQEFFRTLEGTILGI